MYSLQLSGPPPATVYRDELQTLMTEKFHIIDKQDIPVQYRQVA
jgi:hypothetical protein